MESLFLLLLCVLCTWLWVAVLGLRRETRDLRAQLTAVFQALGKRTEAELPAAGPAAEAAPRPAADQALPARPPLTPEPPAWRVPPAPAAPPAEVPLETVVAPPPEAAREVPRPPPAAPEPPAAEPAASSAPAPIPAPPPAAGPDRPSRPAFDLVAFLRQLDWERVVGVKLFSIVAGVLVAIAAIAFAKLAIDRGVVTPPVRFAIATAVGLALVGLSELRFARTYRLTAQSLVAGGVATLFTTFFAAHALWHLLPAMAAFALLALVTAAAVLLSIRHGSMVIAVLGLLGGFATPILVSAGENKPLGLFGYLLLLNAGLSWVAYRRRWIVLPWLSLAFTALYQAGWVARFLDRGQLPLALGIFLVFPVLGFAGVWLAGRGGAEQPPAPFRRAAALGAVPPALFALYAAASADLAGSWPLVLGFLAVVAVGLLLVAAWQGPEWLHPAGAGAVLVVLGVYRVRAFQPEHWPLLSAFLALLVAVYLGGPLLLSRLGRELRGEGRLAVLAAPLLLATFAAVAPAPTAARPATFLLPLVLLAAACSGWAVLRGDARVHGLATGVALLAAAAWGSFHLDGHLYAALLADLALGLLALGAPALAERRGRAMVGAGAGALGAPLLLAALCVLALVACRPAAEVTVRALAGLTLLAGLFVAGLFAEAVRGRNPLLALCGVAVAFLEVGLWLATAAAATALPALLAVLALAGVALAGALLAAPRQPEGPMARALRDGALLALGGHVLVAAVAARPALGLPPAPWLAALLVLDLGFLAAALLRRRGDLLLGAAAATLVVLLSHQVGVRGPAAAIVSVGGGLAGGAFFLGGFLLARRRGIAPADRLGAFGAAALTALHGGQALLLLSGGVLPLGLAVAAQVLLLGMLLAVAWLSGAEWVALAAAALAALVAPALRELGTLHQRAGLDAAALWTATPAWLLALAYPLARGARGRRERLSFLAAVLASGAYLLVARRALLGLGAGPYIGLLPVVQAAMLVPHLRLLLRLEPPSARDAGRLALVAAAVLGLVTVAIPLQLSNQWWTIGWALQAAALAWLWRRIPHPGLLAWSAALFAAAFVRLVPFLNVWIFEYHARGQVPILNWYLYAYLTVAGAHFLGAWLLSGGADRPWRTGPRLSALAGAAGALLLFFLLNVEIADFWSQGERISFRFSAGVAPDLSYTIGWAGFAVGLLLAGVLLRMRGPRVAAIGLLTITLLKGFLHDLGHLHGFYRVFSLLGLATSLAAVALLIQRFVLRRAAAPPAGSGPAGPGPADPAPPTGPEAP